MTTARLAIDAETPSRTIGADFSLWSALRRKAQARSTGFQTGVAEAEKSPDMLHVTRDHTNLAAYLQASYRPRKAWKLVAGGRLYYNEINNHPDNRDFGTLFNSRFSAVYESTSETCTTSGQYKT